MITGHHSKTTLLLAIIILAMPGLAMAEERPENPVATIRVDAGQITWQPHAGEGWVIVRVTGPGEYAFTAEFPPGQLPIFNALDSDGNPLPDGSYNYEIETTLAKGKLRPENDAQGLPQKSLGKPKLFETQFGVFTVRDGSIVDPNLKEGGSKEAGGVSTSATVPGGGISTLDFEIADDLIVTGSACIGFDCVNGESFGFDTIRLKENNLRIKFEDTSTSAGFATTDWELLANDSASGGANKFSINDVTAGTTPFTVTGGAKNNSLFISSTGKTGFGTSTPVLDLHALSSNTPSIRLEQSSSGGFTAQTWDIAGNEANFFVRDVTGGSRLPFRIKPGAGTNALSIESNNDVKIGLTGTSPVGPVILAQESLVTFSTGGTERVKVEANGLQTSAGAVITGAFAVRPAGAQATIVQSGGATYFDSIDGTTGGWLPLNFRAADSTFYHSGSERLRVTSGGVHVTGTLSKSAGTFKIDHPLDPANSYLYHSFVESPDMLNIYNGNAMLDDAGRTVVSLPEWFEALNQDFRYQLTPIGSSAPNLHIAREISDNTFEIAGGPPRIQVSWQVTGIRHDPYAVANRIEVEQEKPLAERGTFLFPGYYENGDRYASAGQSSPVSPAAIIATKNVEIHRLHTENDQLQQQLNTIMKRLTAIETMMTDSDGQKLSSND